MSAASICAKVLRDKEMDHFTFDEDFSEEDRGYGSGYLAGRLLESIIVTFKMPKPQIGWEEIQTRYSVIQAS